MAKHHRNGRGQAAWGARRSRALHGEGPAVLQRAQQLWIAAGAVVLLASLFVLDATRPASALTSSVELDRPLVMRGSGEPVYVLIKLDAPDASGERAERPPLNVALVLDRSGSMEDAGKIDYLRTASAMVVDQLEPSDRLAVVEYDDEITVLWPSGPVEAKGTVKRLIQGLTPRGSTNLTGGMMEGVAQAETTLERATPRQGTITRVLLLSDGLANQGITDPAEIRRLVRTARLDGVRISALGLGRDYDEDLMQAIAENGGGKYHYIEHPNQMARIFEEELNTLFATVVRDARFAFKPGSGVAATQLLTFEDATKEGAVALDMGEFYAKESRTYVLKLDMSGEAFASLGTVGLGTLEVTYTDAESGTERTLETPLSVDVVVDTASVDGAINENVLVESTLLETEIEQRQAIAAFEKGDVKAGQASLTSLIAKIDQVSQSVDDDRLKVKREAFEIERKQMQEAADRPAAAQSYLKASKNRLYQAKTGKRSLYNLTPGDTGLEVERLQQALADTGFYAGPVDGVYSEAVSEAVENYQAANNLSQDGIAGPATMSELGLF